MPRPSRQAWRDGFGPSPTLGFLLDAPNLSESNRRDGRSLRDTPVSATIKPPRRRALFACTASPARWPDAQYDRLRIGQVAVAPTAADRELIDDTTGLVFGVIDEHVSQLFVVAWMASWATLPGKNPDSRRADDRGSWLATRGGLSPAGVVINLRKQKPERFIVAGVIRTGEQRDDPPARTERGIQPLRVNADGSVVASCWVGDRQVAIVGDDRVFHCSAKAAFWLQQSDYGDRRSKACRIGERASLQAVIAKRCQTATFKR